MRSCETKVESSHENQTKSNNSPASDSESQIHLPIPEQQSNDSIGDQENKPILAENKQEESSDNKIKFENSPNSSAKSKSDPNEKLNSNLISTQNITKKNWN